MPDSELAGIAGWAWKCLLENSIYRGRDSAFTVQRRVLDALRSLANGADAIALLVLLEISTVTGQVNAFPWILMPCGRQGC